ncbi:flagellar hook-basal body complex protein FliE [Desulfotomaculum arcticum]|uniref:Flagellar hook-basal body complex protein FliE n=1 Tax=Desulfotruncus arcticus DSM 17038 TaxID=1121424 RepID=A0A1I2MWI8_9FIRM|nr:flagellar hook-basal body complex protein FliE [Desulfotruncus arcticus]SFF95803.1 flagellar hook-basal body complex protein FliE [Desulfotomaculum arcticum] [Desulfotruncus arcticus DSM 17038]
MNIVPIIATPIQDMSRVQQADPNSDSKTSFRDIFDSAINNLNDNQLKVEDTVKNFLTGEIQDIHTVIVAMEEAKLSMQLAVEVRNKLVEAYQEISRMQI